MIYGFDSSKNLVGIQGRIIDIGVNEGDTIYLEIGDSVITSEIAWDDAPNLSKKITVSSGTYLVEKICTNSLYDSTSLLGLNTDILFRCEQYCVSSNTDNDLVLTLYPFGFLRSNNQQLAVCNVMRWKITRIS